VARFDDLRWRAELEDLGNRLGEIGLLRPYWIDDGLQRRKQRPMAGYSGTPLAKKLGIRPGFRVALVDAPGGFEDLLDGLPGDAAPKRGWPRGEADILVVFVTAMKDLEKQLPRAIGKLSPEKGAGIWVAWPKKASGVKTDVTEDVVRAVALPLGVVDNKVCAIDDVWSGLRLVVRKEHR
jgi:hypothetical protein